MDSTDGRPAPQQPPTVREVGEFGLIDLVTAEAGTSGRVLIGPGDDAAQVSTRTGHVLVSTDLLVEGRHFRRDWATAEQVGRRAAAANLSDINAMGGVATALTVGLAAPADLPSQWVVDLARGFEAECALVGAHVVGGDMTAADSIVIAVTALGEAPTAVPRDGAVAGDVVAVAGRLGWSAAGLAALSRGFRSPRSVVDAHLVPAPPYASGPAAAAVGATSMIDVSDGLLADAGHVALASGVVIEIDTELLEVPEPVATVASALGRLALDFVLTGGEDFALVATFSRHTNLPDGWRPIGTVRDPGPGEEPGVRVDGETREGTGGHVHWE